jgi:hypothetical protein
MWDPSVALCLTPQAFSNINPKADIFNNINQQVGSLPAGGGAGRGGVRGGGKGWYGIGSSCGLFGMRRCAGHFLCHASPPGTLARAPAPAAAGPALLQFWEYVLPGCDAWGYVACTGTNFCLRARALAAVGWFPEYTITEGGVGRGGVEWGGVGWGGSAGGLRPPSGAKGE